MKKPRWKVYRCLETRECRLVLRGPGDAPNVDVVVAADRRGATVTLDGGRVRGAASHWELVRVALEVAGWVVEESTRRPRGALPRAWELTLKLDGAPEVGLVAASEFSRDAELEDAADLLLRLASRIAKVK